MWCLCLCTISISITWAALMVLYYTTLHYTTLYDCSYVTQLAVQLHFNCLLMPSVRFNSLLYCVLNWCRQSLYFSPFHYLPITALPTIAMLVLSFSNSLLPLCTSCCCPNQPPCLLFCSTWPSALYHIAHSLIAALIHQLYCSLLAHASIASLRCLLVIESLIIVSASSSLFVIIAQGCM